MDEGVDARLGIPHPLFVCARVTPPDTSGLSTLAVHTWQARTEATQTSGGGESFCVITSARTPTAYMSIRSYVV